MDHECCASRLEASLGDLKTEVGDLKVEVMLVKRDLQWRNKLLIVIGSLLGAIAAALLGSCASVPSVPADAVPPAAVEMAAPPDRMTGGLVVVCTKESAEVEPYLVTGTGVIIDPNRVLTARHVVDCDGGTAVKVVFGTASQPGVYSLELERVGVSQADDWAVLHSETAFPEWAVLGDAPVNGDIVCMYTTIPNEKVSCGAVEFRDSSRVSWGGAGYFDYKAPGCPAKFSEPGNSGAGIWDADHHLVGINVGHLLDTCVDAGMGYSVGRFKDRLP